MIEKLTDYKKDIDADLQRMTSSWRKEWGDRYTPVTLTVLDSLIDFMNRGGKRVRGSLAMESYFMHGGQDETVALGAARVVELVNASLLVMDDIQDKSLQRRGGPTVHTQLAREHSQHYGTAQALNAEMLASQQAISELMNLPVADHEKVRAATLLSEDISVTIVGQINDIYNELVARDVGREVIIDTLTWKTAYYTFVNPLELGACLAGADGLSDRLRQYALKAGVAFQISDDILGVFGDSREVGKSADDDIREGKATLLMAYAREHVDARQQEILDTILGKNDASAVECDQVREVLQTTGAHEFALGEAQRYCDEAVAALGETSENFLVELVRFAVNRKA